MSDMDVRQFGKVAVLMGGVSGEREVSLRSGQAVLQALQAGGVDAHAIDPKEDVFERLLQGGYERVFIALHGYHGEDGTLQGGLEMVGLPYTGSGVLASSLCMDKLMTKKIWKASEIPTPSYRVLNSLSDCHEAVDSLQFPLVVKPALEGSSLGIHIVRSIEEFHDAYEDARQYHGAILAEQFISGAEYTVAVLNDQVLPVIKLETTRSFYDYTAKYESDDTHYICPCGLPEEIEESLKIAAMQAFKAVGASGWGRVDVMMDEKQNAWFLEVNTVPGMTDHSLVPMAAKAHGIDFNQLVLRILQTSCSQEEVHGATKTQ